LILSIHLVSKLSLVPSFFVASRFSTLPNRSFVQNKAMAPPSADYEVAQSVSPTTTKVRTIPELKKSVAGLTQSASFPAPLEYSGALDHYESFDVTSVIGREFPKLQLTDILNDDAKIRDLAILGMERPSLC
jgi:hypothetical protein